jgi:hypothetical protein
LIFDLLIGHLIEKLLQEKSSQESLNNEFGKTAFATPISCLEIPMARHYLDHDLPEEVKFVSPFISPKTVFHPNEIERPLSPSFKFKPCPSSPIFHDKSLKKENFCATDPPNTSTLEDEKKISQTSMKTSLSNFIKICACIRSLQSPSCLAPHALTRATTTLRPSLAKCL